MLNRTIAPPFNRTTRFDLITPETVTLGNGVPVHFISGGNQNVLKIELVFKAGRWFEPQWGAAYFASNLLTKGTRDKSSFSIAQTFDRYGAHVEVAPGLDVVSVSLYSLTGKLQPVLPVLVELLQHSVFPEKELEQMKSIYLQNLKVNQEKTSFQASKLLRKSLFGENHPYGKELEAAEITALQRDVLVDYYEHHFGDLFILVSGKLEADIRTLITDTFAALNVAPVAGKTFAPPVSIPSRQVVDKADSVQSSLRIGKRFIGRTHPDYVDTLFLNHLLGGYFGSRLMKNIREEKGLTYGIYSSIHTLKNDNYMVIGADVNKENMELAFDEIRKELIRLRVEPIDAEEIETARNHFIGSLQSEIVTPFAHADKVKNILLFNLPADYYPKLIQRLDALRSDDLVRVAETYFTEDSFFETAVG